MCIHVIIFAAPLMAPTKPESLVLGAPALSEPMPTLASATATHVTPPRATSSLATAVETSAPATPAVDETGRKVQKNRNRCFVDTCRKKLEYTGFECRCGYVFCSAHRYADEVCAEYMHCSCLRRGWLFTFVMVLQHNCTHDHKAESATLLKKANPKVVADKFERV